MVPRGARAESRRARPAGRAAHRQGRALLRGSGCPGGAREPLVDPLGRCRSRGTPVPPALRARAAGRRARVADDEHPRCEDRRRAHRRQGRLESARRGARAHQPARRGAVRRPHDLEPRGRRSAQGADRGGHARTIDDRRARAARQGIRALSRRVPPRRGGSPPQRARTLRGARELGGPAVEHSRAARDGTEHCRDRRAARRRERGPGERPLAQAGARRDRPGDPRLAHPRAEAGAPDRSPAPAA